MRRLLTPLVFLALFLSAATLAYVVVQHRDEYVHEQEANTKAVVQADAERQSKLTSLEASLAGAQEKNDRLMAECMKGQEAYNALTAFNKTRFEAPTCEPAPEPMPEEPVTEPEQ